MKNFHGNIYQKKNWFWHDLNQKNIIKKREMKKLIKIEKNNFLKNLYKIGYSKNLNKI